MPSKTNTELERSLENHDLWMREEHHLLEILNLRNDNSLETTIGVRNIEIIEVITLSTLKLLTIKKDKTNEVHYNVCQSLCDIRKAADSRQPNSSFKMPSKEKQRPIVPSRPLGVRIPGKYAIAEGCCRKIQNGPSMVLRLGSLTGRSMEIAEMLERKRINICCLQEIRWKSNGVCHVNSDKEKYKLFWNGQKTAKNGVGIFVREPLAQEVLDIKSINSRLIWIKLRLENLCVEDGCFKSIDEDKDIEIKYMLQCSMFRVCQSCKNNE
ncbi:hypothetical protein HELRODRAFT_179117 [Helobdella robusta]|uniref:Endonuclease/exonuclease/phosphatase domain-containing protein n=1 Tax=Helobdella robusta TaxID=6412 RepID=T1FE67_HELRO|nr:hypothetical protein HELRODRAFT_179117 [Helobdella robusta]ESN95647.1 hypothetical protein HELRODRAFT_179117 [Helobdella robusta]